MKKLNTILYAIAVAAFTFLYIACEKTECNSPTLNEIDRLHELAQSHIDSIYQNGDEFPDRGLQILVPFDEYGVEYTYDIGMGGTLINQSTYTPQAGVWALDTAITTFSGRTNDMRFINYNLEDGMIVGLSFFMFDQINDIEYLYSEFGGEVHIERRLEEVQETDTTYAIWPWHLDGYAVHGADYPYTGAQTGENGISINRVVNGVVEPSPIDVDLFDSIRVTYNNGFNELALGNYGYSGHADGWVEDTLMMTWGNSYVTYSGEQRHGWHIVSGQQNSCDTLDITKEPARYIIQTRHISATAYLDGAGYFGESWGEVRREDTLCYIDGSTRRYPQAWRGKYNNILGDQR